MRQVHLAHWQTQLGGNNLHRSAVDAAKCGTQGFMPLDNLLQTRLEHGSIQRAADTHAFRNIVEWAVRLQLIEKPQPLLGEGERQLAITRNDLERRNMNTIFGKTGLIDGSGQLRDGRQLENASQREFYFEEIADSANHLRSQKRVPAQLEKVVVSADPFLAQYFPPNPGDHFLRRSKRRDVGGQRN